MHRDVSPDNILIDIFTRKGILNDWDLSKYDEDLKAGLGACEPAGISVSPVVLSWLIVSYIVLIIRVFGLGDMGNEVISRSSVSEEAS